MMANSKRSPKTSSTVLAFFGTADTSATVLTGLLAAGYKIAIVVTKPDVARGRGRRLQPPQIKQIAQKHGVPVVQPATKADILPALENHDVAWGVVAAFGMILPDAVIDYFEGGLVNVHASLLPRWRGPSPIEAAILHGDSETGISLMRVVAAMDAGPVYTQAKVAIDAQTTRPDLYHTLGQLGMHKATCHLPAIIDGDLEATAQDDIQATYCKLLSKADGIIDWSQPARDLERQIRAYLGWPGSHTTIADTEVTITEAKVLDVSGPPGDAFTTDDNQLAVYCEQGALLITRLKPAGKREMFGKEFLAGHQL